MNIEYVKKDGQVKMGIAVPAHICKYEPAVRMELVKSLPVFTAAELRTLADELDRRNA